VARSSVALIVALAGGEDEEEKAKLTIAKGASGTIHAWVDRKLYVDGGNNGGKSTSGTVTVADTFRRDDTHSADGPEAGVGRHQ
jgi:hypothetical protein